MGYKLSFDNLLEKLVLINSHRNVHYEGKVIFADKESVVLGDVKIYDHILLIQGKDLVQIEREDILDVYVTDSSTNEVMNCGEGWIPVVYKGKRTRKIIESKHLEDWNFTVPNKPPKRYLHDDKRYQMPSDVQRIIQNELKPWDSMSDSEKETLERVNKILQEGLKPHNYKNYFYFLLFVEEVDLELSISKCSMMLDISRGVNGGFSFEAQCILDKSPDLVAGDKIYLKKRSDNVRYGAFITKIDGPKVFAAVENWKDQMDKIFGKKKEKINVQIIFTLNKYLLFSKRAALNNLRQEDIERLFPANEQPPKTLISSKLRKSDLYDKSIFGNTEQFQAVNYILGKTSGHYPYILFGPPGTGKTAALVEAIKQVYFKKKFSTIIVTAPSNLATNLLALKLLQHIPKKQLIRVFAASHEETHEIPKNLEDISKVGFSWLGNKVLRKRVICLTLSMCPHLINLDFKASHLFIDEAAQMTEPDLVLALSDVLNDDCHVILSGDHHQLGPVVKSSLAKKLGLTMSPMERLMKFRLYAKDDAKNYNRLFVTKLLHNYRSHSSILEISNRLFYDGELKSVSNEARTELIKTIQWLPSFDFPLIFHNIQGKFEKDHPSTSIYNKDEAKLVLNYVMDLQNVNVKPHDIGIITPYRSQCRYIMKLLNDHKISSEILVGSTEEFQGQERSVIILSLCRSTIGPRGQPSEELGFLTCPKRFNVSLTRAKGVQIVIGDEKLLSENVLWNEYIKSCSAKGTAIGLKSSNLVFNLGKAMAKKTARKNKKH